MQDSPSAPVARPAGRQIRVSCERSECRHRTRRLGRRLNDECDPHRPRRALHIGRLRHSPRVCWTADPSKGDHVVRRHEALPRVHVTLDARLSHRHAKAYLIAAGTCAAGSRPLGKQAGLPARCPSRGRESDSPRRSLTEPSAISGGDGARSIAASGTSRNGAIARPLLVVRSESHATTAAGACSPARAAALRACGSTGWRLAPRGR